MKRKSAKIPAKRVPQQRRSKALVEAILEAGTRVLKDSDFTRSTTNRIAEIAGVSIGSLYQYFPDKNVLVASLIERQARKNLNLLEAEIVSVEKLPLSDALDHLCDRIVELFLKESPFFRKLFLVSPYLGKVDAIIQTRKRGEELFAHFLDSISPKNTDPEILRARAFISVHAAMGVIQFCGLAGLPNGWDKNRLKRELRELFRSYLE